MVAPSMRRCCWTCLAWATSKPRAEAPAVPALTAPIFRNWRRVTSMGGLLGTPSVGAGPASIALFATFCGVESPKRVAHHQDHGIPEGDQVGLLVVRDPLQPWASWRSWRPSG